MYSYWQVNCVVLCEVAFVIKCLKEVLIRNLIRNIYFTKFHSLLQFGILFCGGAVCGGWGAGGELTVRILRVQKLVIRSTVALVIEHPADSYLKN